MYNECTCHGKPPRGVRSLAIVDYRTANGPFSSVDDLMKVSGIDEKILKQIKRGLDTIKQKILSLPRYTRYTGKPQPFPTSRSFAGRAGRGVTVFTIQDHLQKSG